MHGNHRLLPFFSRLDDGQVVERGRSAGAALVAGSAQADPADGDPRLLELALRALDQPPGSTVLVGDGGTTTRISAPAGGELALVGLRCPPGTAALASSVPCRTLWPDGQHRSGVLAWSVDRQGGSLALFRGENGAAAETLAAVAGPLLDTALRALGLPTAPCHSPAVWFPDGVFLHRVAGMLARRGGPCGRRRLSWDSLSMLYPLNDTGAPQEPGLTRRSRQRFQSANTWSSLRRGAAGLPAGSPAILPGLTPRVAGWLDDGAFARWVLSRVPDAPSARGWLCQSLSGPAAENLALALSDVHGSCQEMM